MAMRKGTRKSPPQDHGEELSSDPDFKDPQIPELMKRVFRGDGNSPPRTHGPARRVKSQSVETKGANWYKDNAVKTSPASSPSKGGSQRQAQGAVEMEQNETSSSSTADSKDFKTKNEAFQAGVEHGRAQKAAEEAASKAMSAGDKVKAFFAHNWGKMLMIGGAAAAGVAGDRMYQRYQADQNRRDNVNPGPAPAEGGNR